MAKVSSAVKRYLQSEKRRARNKHIRSRVRTAEKKLRAAIHNNDKELARDALKSYSSLIDNAVQKGVYNKNTSSRKKSRLACQANVILR